MKTVGIVVLVLGILGIILGGLVTGISLLLPVVTDGRTSWDEAMIGIIPGAIVLVLSFFVAVIGAIVFVIGRKKASQ
jgi:Na+-transporting NADH:ubiquinone oxidoreductase subunit NqrB